MSNSLMRLDGLASEMSLFIVLFFFLSNYIITFTKLTPMVIGLFGIFGAGDLGKTWKCNNCGSKW